MSNTVNIPRFGKMTYLSPDNSNISNLKRFVDEFYKPEMALLDARGREIRVSRLTPQEVLEHQNNVFTSNYGSQPYCPDVFIPANGEIKAQPRIQAGKPGYLFEIFTQGGRSVLTKPVLVQPTDRGDILRAFKTVLSLAVTQTLSINLPRDVYAVQDQYTVNSLG